jgi:hypothetical protein
LTVLLSDILSPAVLAAYIVLGDLISCGEDTHPLLTMMLEVPTCTRRGYAGSNPIPSLRWGTGSSPQVVNLTCPSPNGEGFFLLFDLLLFKKIVFYFLVIVDGHMSRENRDKCPEHPWILD